MTAATKNLEKWLFYFDRFNNHEISAKLDQGLCEATEERMVEVQEASDLSWIEVSPSAPQLACDLITTHSQSKFMQHAVDALTRCRLTLKWSYTMAFYLAQGNQKQIFEDLQA
jgi:ariadne-1